MTQTEKHYCSNCGNEISEEDYQLDELCEDCRMEEEDWDYLFLAE